MKQILLQHGPLVHAYVCMCLYYKLGISWEKAGKGGKRREKAGKGGKRREKAGKGGITYLCMIEMYLLLLLKQG